MPRILLVEDDLQVRSMLSETLRQEGYEVTEAADGNEALALFGQGPTDMVITDILMPNKEGLSLITDLRKTDPEVLIIAFSGGAQRLTPGCNLELARMFGAARTFQKPLDIDALLAAITEMLAQGPQAT